MLWKYTIFCSYVAITIQEIHFPHFMRDLCLCQPLAAIIWDLPSLPSTSWRFTHGQTLQTCPRLKHGYNNLIIWISLLPGWQSTVQKCHHHCGKSNLHWRVMASSSGQGVQYITVIGVISLCEQCIFCNGQIWNIQMSTFKDIYSGSHVDLLFFLIMKYCHLLSIELHCISLLIILKDINIFAHCL